MAQATVDDLAALARVIRGENGNDCPAQARVLRWLVYRVRYGEPLPHLAAMAREIGLPRQGVARALRRLRDRGFLELHEHREPRQVPPKRDRITRTFAVRVPAEAQQLHLPLTG